MIGVIFQFGSEIVEVRVDGGQILFRSSHFGGHFGTIDNLKLDKSGSIKEHPDLKGNNHWEEETRKRFKEKIKSYTTEEQKIKYIIEDLKKFGYVATYYQKSGHRPIKIKQ